MKLIIDRNTWGRGAGSRESKLLNPSTGKKCCVGFYANALGLTDEDIKGKAIMEDLLFYCESSKIPDWCIGRKVNEEIDIRSLYAVNDRKGILEEEREKQIVETFAKHDVQVEFID